MKERTKDIASIITIIALLSTIFWMRWSRAQSTGNYPNRPISLICPFSPGGGTDLLARTLARSVEEDLGVPVLVENITGGGGAAGMAAGLLAPADGYHATLVTFELISLPVQGLVPFTYDDYELLMQLNMDPAALTVRGDFPADNLEDFLQWAKAQDGVTIGNSGPGSVWHLASECLGKATGIQVIPIPFNGASAAVTALVGGHIDAVTVSPGEVQTQVRAGQVKILAIMSEERLKSFPGTPTFNEKGVPLVFGTWRGLGVPKETPFPERNRLAESFKDALANSQTQNFAQASGINLDYVDSDRFRAKIARQSKDIEALMNEMGMAK